MVERQFVSAPLMPHYPLTVLCFSLQKSLAPSLSSAPVPVQEARPSGPLEVVREQVPVHTCPAATPQSYMRATWATLHPTISSRYLTLPYPRILLAPLYVCKFGRPKDSHSLSCSPIIILTRAILNMAEVPLFQYGWQTTSVPQLRPHASVVDKLSVFSTSRYAGLASSPCDVTFTNGPGPNSFLASTRIPIADQ